MLSPGAKLATGMVGVQVRVNAGAAGAVSVSATLTPVSVVSPVFVARIW